jgi:phospholipase/carboxylesterase
MNRRPDSMSPIDSSAQRLDPHDDPHASGRVERAGAPLEGARAAMVMIHGRGAAPANILTLVPAIAVDDVAYLAPEAVGGQWYPYGFMSPIPQNEPGITSGMHAISRVLATVLDAGIPLERTFILGFSQGACLASEFVARHAVRYGGLAALSGGLIGPDDTPRDYEGSLDGMPVFMGCSDVDGHIPATRVRESAAVLKALGATVDMRLYPGMGHLVNDEEIEAVRAMLEGAL